jgi:penicillin-binding protein 2
MPVKKETDRYEGVENRVQWVGIALMAAMIVLGIQFWRLQVLSLNEFSKLAEDNRVWQKRLASDRGVIFDRSGEVLADNRASADVILVPGECPAEMIDAVCARLAEWLGVDGAALRQKVDAFRSAPFTQILVKRDVTKADRIRIDENLYALPGVTTVVHPQRRYLYGETAGQILGYLGEINESELQTYLEQGYVMGDLIGKDGLESYYESLLHGQDGYMLVTKYASGQPQLRTDRSGRPYIARFDTRGHLLNLEAEPVLPHAGKALELTLDIRLQQYCEELLRSEQGAIVVLDADTGAVLALASMPSYDPSVFVNRGMNEQRMDLLSGQRPNRMSNRCYRELYPPGSLFKIMLAAAALEENVADSGTATYCPGHFQIDGKGRKWHCWRRSGHGRMVVEEALAYSCDVYFYNIGLKLGVDRINKYANMMGLGVATGIDLPGEQFGLIPSREWKAKQNVGMPTWEQQWYPGETVNLSIGQGAATTTPLQNAVMMACIVNGGYRVQPHLWAGGAAPLSEKLFRDDTIEVVRKGLLLCVEKGPPSPTGTGHSAYIPGMTIMGKTGTAQVVSLSHLEQYTEIEDIPYEQRHHAWFVAGVLDQTPRLSVCVLIEHGHAGGTAAAPVARDVIEFFYEQNSQDPSRTVAAKE